jgi:hypothetical protein
MVASKVMFSLTACKIVHEAGLVAIFEMAVVRVCVTIMFIIVTVFAVMAFTTITPAVIAIIVTMFFIMAIMFAVMAFTTITPAVIVTTIRIIPVGVTVGATVIGVFGCRFSFLQNAVRFQECRIGPGIGFRNPAFGRLLLPLQKRLPLGQLVPGSFKPVRLPALVIRFFIIGDFRGLHEKFGMFRRCIIGKMVYTVFIRPGVNVGMRR